MAKERLELFLEKADELLGSQFAKQALRPGALQLRILATPFKNEIVTTGPTNEQLRAALLTFRLLYKNQKDGISIFCIQRHLERLKLDPHFTYKRSLEEFEKTHSKLSNFVYCRPGFNDHPTWCEVIDVFLHGNYAHVQSHRNQRVKFKRWTGEPDSKPAFEFAFRLAVADVCDFLNWSRQYVAEALRCYLRMPQPVTGIESIRKGPDA